MDDEPGTKVIGSENAEKLEELDYSTFMTTIYILEQYEGNII